MGDQVVYNNGYEDGLSELADRLDWNQQYYGDAISEICANMIKEQRETEKK